MSNREQQKNISMLFVMKVFMYFLSFCLPPHSNLFRTASKGHVFTLLAKCSDVFEVVYYNSWHIDPHGCVNEKMQSCGAKEYQIVL